MAVGLSETLIFYLVVGGVVAVAVYAADDRGSRAGAGLRLSMAVVFWPLYLPLLLSARAANRPADPPAQQPDAMAAAIADVERELDTAPANLDGWAEKRADREKGRIAELRTALSAQARRIREMDALLADVASQGDSPVRPMTRPARRHLPTQSLGATTTDRAAQTVVGGAERPARRIWPGWRRCGGKRIADLMATLAWIRELVSMMHLAKFTGVARSRTESLMAQIAAAVEGVSDAGHRNAEDEPWEAIVTVDV